MLSQEQQAAVVTNTGKPPLSRCQSKESELRDDDNEDDEEEEGFAMISVRGNPASQEDNQAEETRHKQEVVCLEDFNNDLKGDEIKKQYSADQQKIQLPLPAELFGDSKTSDFEQPILSAKVELPKTIFDTD